MAQRMIYLSKLRHVSTQTDDKKDFMFFLSDYKFVRIYKSRAYKEYVISINFGKCKKYIITKSMWQIFKSYFDQIDGALGN